MITALMATIIQRNKEVNKMKKYFADPALELVLFGSDVITSSDGGGGFDTGTESLDNNSYDMIQSFNG